MSSQQATNQKDTNQSRAVITQDTDSRALFIIQKCKRIANALYAVTRFFPVDEPLRARIRAHALTLIERVNAAGSQDTHITDVMSEVTDQLTIAYNGELVSKMNYNVLNDEIQKIITELKETGVSLDTKALSNAYFSVDTNTSPSKETIKNQDKDKENIKDNQKDTLDTGSSQSTQTTQPASDTQETTSQPNMSAKEKRREEIRDLLKSEGEISINDAADIITGYSKKTIQRDLKAMVKNGELEKKGKRRWSTYTFSK